MTYLELCQKLRLEAGISGDGPVTVIDQIGQLKSLIGWINDAWLHIQAKRTDWYFMWNTFSFETTEGGSDYTGEDAEVSDLGYWNESPLKIYKTSAGQSSEGYLRWLCYEDWRRWYSLGVTPNNTPTIATVLPNNKLRLYPTPNDAYTVSGDYIKAPIPLALDGDIPSMPTRFHDLIVYEALQLFGMHEEAVAVVQQGQTLAAPLWAQLYRDQLPSIEIGEALA